MNPFGRGFVLGGLCTAFMLAMGNVAGSLLFIAILLIAAFMTWLPDKYIFPKGSRYNP
jgi:hypothetical protein